MMTDDVSSMPKPMSPNPAVGHMMAADDPDNPLNWPVHQKVYTSLVSFGFGFAVYVSTVREASSHLITFPVHSELLRILQVYLV